MNRLLLSLVVCLATLPAMAMEKWQGYCQQGGVKVSMASLGQSTSKFMQSFPGCTVTVYDSGTSNLSTIYSDNSSTPKSNPFVADTTTGLGFFYAANGLYDIKFSGGGIASPFTLAGWLLNDPVATTICYTTDYPASTTGGIAECYAAGPSTGVHVVIGADITIVSAQTITMTTHKPLYLDFNGRKINCTNTSGECLRIVKPDSDPRYELVIYNGTINYGGSSTGITGLGLGSVLANLTNCSVYGMSFQNFSTTNSIALDTTGMEDCHIHDNSFSLNYLDIKLAGATNNNVFTNNRMQLGTNAISCTGCMGNAFIGNLIQSKQGAKPIQIIATSGQAVNSLVFRNNWLENDGDTTNATRYFYFSATVGNTISNITIEDNLIAAATYGANATVYEANGSGSFSAFSFRNNNYTANGTFPELSTGFTASTPIASENDGLTVAGFGANIPGISDEVDSGAFWCPPAGSTCFQMYSNTPDGSFSFRDLTNHRFIWVWNGTSFDQYQPVKYLGGNLIRGYSDAGTTLKWTIDSSTGKGTFLGGLDTNLVGITNAGPISGATSLAMNGALSGATSIGLSGQLTSTLAIGTAPFVITSTTKVANLNVDWLDGADWAAPLAIGSTTPAGVTGTTINATTAYQANGTPGISATLTVRDSAGTGTCTITISKGIVTATTC